MTGPRFSLRTFMIVCIAFGCAAGLFCRGYFKAFITHEQKTTSEGVRYEKCLVISGFLHECKYVIFYARGVNPLRTTSVRGEVPPETGLSYHPEGLYFDGKIIDTTGNRMVFVYCSDGTLQNIEVNNDELHLIQRQQFEEFISSDSYRTKIAPLLEMERTTSLESGRKAGP